ncbi:MAG: maleate cis-trans isomerase family protein [Candidatus Binatia bacterium]
MSTFGWRARIGYLCPSVFEQITCDFYRMAPPGVGMIGVTCMIDGWSPDAYKTGLDQIERCAQELGRRKCDFIVHAGVPLVVTQGAGFEKEIVKKVEAISGTRATTSIVAAMEALQALSIHKVALVNPYPPELNGAVVGFLKGHGFDVRSVISLGVDFTHIGDITEGDVFTAARKAVKESGEVDGLYLPCPQFPVLDVIENIESDLGVPAVGHLSSELWLALRTVGVKTPIHGFGKLLSTL